MFFTCATVTKTRPPHSLLIYHITNFFNLTGKNADAGPNTEACGSLEASLPRHFVANRIIRAKDDYTKNLYPIKSQDDPGNRKMTNMMQITKYHLRLLSCPTLKVIVSSYFTLFHIFIKQQSTDGQTETKITCPRSYPEIKRMYR